jgi:hypothetical protein
MDLERFERVDTVKFIDLETSALTLLGAIVLVETRWDLLNGLTMTTKD